MEKDQTVHERSCDSYLAFRVSYLAAGFQARRYRQNAERLRGILSPPATSGSGSRWREAGFSSREEQIEGSCTRQVCCILTRIPRSCIRTLNLQLSLDCWCSGYADIPQGFTRDTMHRPEPTGIIFQGCLRILLQWSGLSLCFSAATILRTLPVSGIKIAWRKILDIGIGREDGFVYLEVKAESFLWHQVRCIAGSASFVGTVKPMRHLSHRC